MRVVLALWLLAGCDKLFGLDEISSDRRDAAGAMDGDALVAVPDAPVDAKPCPPSIIHDEDNDTLDDSCDACPTIASNPPVDTDGDGLSDPCDADHDPGAQYIVASWMFITDADFTAFTHSNLQHQTTDNGRFYIFSGGMMRATTQYTPTKIELKMRDVFEGVAADLAIGHGNAVCHVIGANCTGNDTSLTCVDLEGPNPNATGPARLQVQTIAMFYKNNLVQCRVEGQGGASTTVTESTPVPLPTANPTISANTMGGGGLIRSIVIYANKP